MKVRYSSFFRVGIAHSYYASGISTGDFVVTPTLASRQALDALGVIFRTSADGFGIYGETVPDSVPPELRRTLRDTGLRLRFVLTPRHPYFGNITALPAHRPGRTVFYFDNLREDAAGGNRFLGDSLANARLGAPLRLVTGASYTHELSAPTGSGTITLTDLFGTVALTESFSSSEPISQYRVDLSRMSPSGSGVYTLSDSLGGSERLFIDPDLAGEQVFGVVEIFSSTSLLTSDGSNRVPTTYRFFSGDTLVEDVSYVIEFVSRATTWRYVVTKTHDANSISLDSLAITGGVGFTKSVDSERAVFTSNSLVDLGERHRELTLEHNSDSVRKLPNPKLSTPLQESASADQFVSEMYVFV